MPSSTEYKLYQTEVTAEIRDLIADLGCQPIIFAGSGISRRYFSGPSWDDLLQFLSKRCPSCDKDYAYYKQKYGNPLETGTAFSELYFEWAWSTGRNEFPKEMYVDGVRRDAFVKYYIAERLKSLVPTSLDRVADRKLRDELASLQEIRPHAVITTNYDSFLELVFPEYASIVGQRILQSQSFSVGEILKIHGCVSDPSSIVITNDDYNQFIRKKKYLSAKLLTYFSEHPVLILGYSAEDRNIRAILSDIDEALPISGDIIRNIYFVDWSASIAPDARPPKEKLLAIDDSKSVRVRCIVANDFSWIYEAFKSPDTINKVSPKLLRALLARSYELVRHDIPRKAIEADFKMLEGAVQNSEEFAKLIGITTIQDPSHITANYPHTLTNVSRALGFPGWHGAHKLMDVVEKEKKLILRRAIINIM